MCSSDLRLSLYHIPPVSNVAITLELIERLLARYPGIVAGAKDSSGDWHNTKAMLDRDKPVLGICGGQQLLAVVLGGTLIQHIPDSITDALAHEQPNPRNEPGHDVAIAPDTMLHRIIGDELIPVNSAHHQAVKDVPSPIVVDAVAPDGVIEGIEDPRYKFCIGVQWHPEFHISPADVRLFAAFVDACRDKSRP